MFKGFRDFIMRGNVVDLAVAVVIGAAFGAVITSFVNDVLMQIIAAVGGQPDFSSLSFKIGEGVIKYGSFLNALITFLLIAAAVYFVVVLPMNKLAERRAKGQDPTTRECPHCLSEIPVGATRCPHCTSELAAAS
ncbi:MAG TPA: large conductance mechanosensitive channel protein MscL [Thermoleophilia bacterium]|nr:large conductance mechanosensitive channel protein MscL [Thermoleophilia bacterium]